MNDITDHDDTQTVGREHQPATPSIDRDAVTRTAEDAISIAVEAADVARRAHVRDVASGKRAGGRGVEWVRPSDLIARHTSQLAGRGIDLHTALAARSRAALKTSARSTNHRIQRLSPLSAFGTGSRTIHTPERSGVGLS